MICKSAPFSSYDLIITNQRQNSMLSKIIQFEKKQSHSFLIFEKICKRIIKKTIFLVYSGPLKVNFRQYMQLLKSQCLLLTLITVSFLYSIIFQYQSPLFCLFLFHISFLNLLTLRHILQFSYSF